MKNGYSMRKLTLDRSWWMIGKKKYEQFVGWCGTCHSKGKTRIVTLDEFFPTVFISSVS